MKTVETRGTWAGLPIIIQGIVTDGGDVIAVKVLDDTKEPISWAMTGRQIAQAKHIISTVNDCEEEPHDAN